jgi:hypothetical protein
MNKRDVEYKAQMRRQLYIRSLTDILVKCLKRLSAEELKQAIENGWSLVDFFKSQPAKANLAFFQSIPSLSFIMLGLGKNPQSLRLVLLELESISLDEVLDSLGKKLPEHAQVLRDNPDWVRQEIEKMKTLLST